MKFDNPTLVQIGMTGTFVGIRYRVLGRAVMSVEEDGETYYWNEFNLEGDNGQCATLVYEDAESGSDWKLFTLFEPKFPMTVAEADAKKVGDNVNLDGTPMRITLVDESHVDHIEGVAPEGVEVGDVAYYFNAEIPSKMLVASWTGEEIEFYHGLNLPGHAVPQAFGLERALPQNSFNLRAEETANANWIPKIVGLFLVVIIGFAVFSFFKSRHQPAFPVQQKPKLAPSPRLIGLRGNLEGKSYRVTRDAVVEIAQVGRRYDQHEYHLLDDDGKTALLIFGSKPGAKNWVLFTPLEERNWISPRQAGAIRVGDKVVLDANEVKVTELFQAKILQAQGLVGELRNGMLFYGFKAGVENHLLACWNEERITFYRGKNCAETEVLAAFK